MAQHHWIANPELIKRLHKQRRLSRSVPDPEPRSLAITKPWPVEADNAISLSKKINKTADDEILEHGSVAMEQHHTRSGRIAALNVVETYAVALG